LVRFEQNDLFKADIHEATVVMLFLLSTLNFRLRTKLLQEVAPGTRIVSNTFSMGDWPPDKELTVETSKKDDLLSRKLYLWFVPPRSAKIVSRRGKALESASSRAQTGVILASQQRFGLPIARGRYPGATF
jgi:hypothetical protein